MSITGDDSAKLVKAKQILIDAFLQLRQSLPRNARFRDRSVDTDNLQPLDAAAADAVHRQAHALAFQMLSDLQTDFVSAVDRYRTKINSHLSPDSSPLAANNADAVQSDSGSRTQCDGTVPSEQRPHVRSHASEREVQSEADVL